MTGALLESGLQPVDVAAETRPVPWEVVVFRGAKGYWDIINSISDQPGSQAKGEASGDRV